MQRLVRKQFRNLQRNFRISEKLEGKLLTGCFDRGNRALCNEWIHPHECLRNRSAPTMRCKVSSSDRGVVMPGLISFF